MSVKVTLNGDGLNYSKDASVVQAAQIIGFLNNTETQAGDSSLRNEPIILGEPTKPRKSPREYLLDTGARTNTQKILALSDYVSKRDSVEVISILDVKSAFSKAGEPVPRNFSRDLKDAVQTGYISEDDNQAGHYFITNKGYEVLENSFEKGQRAVRRRTKRSNGQGGSVVPINEKVSKLSFSDLLDGYPNYHSLNSKTERAMWIITYAKFNDIESLSGKEIEYVAQQLSDNIPNSQIAAAMRMPLAKGFISKIKGSYRIIHKGEEYLKEKI